MLRACNAEAENAVKTVKAGNLASAQKRLSTARDQIAKQGHVSPCVLAAVRQSGPSSDGSDCLGRLPTPRESSLDVRAGVEGGGDRLVR